MIRDNYRVRWTVNPNLNAALCFKSLITSQRWTNCADDDLFSLSLSVWCWPARRVIQAVYSGEGFSLSRHLAPSLQLSAGPAPHPGTQPPPLWTGASRVVDSLLLTYTESSVHSDHWTPNYSLYCFSPIPIWGSHCLNSWVFLKDLFLAFCRSFSTCWIELSGNIQPDILCSTSIVVQEHFKEPHHCTFSLLWWTQAFSLF